MKRRTILAAAPLLLIPRVARAFHLSGGRPSGISPDGSQIDTATSLGSTVTNAYGVWGFGRSINGPTAASPWGPPGETGPFTGPFNYVTLNGRAIQSIGLFGPGSVRTGACTILIFNGGQAYFGTAENDRQWFRYSNYDGFRYGAGSPTISDLSTLPLPTYTPPYTPSPDGTTLTSTVGSVTTLEGVWTNGAGGSSWFPTLNGIPYSAADPTHVFNQMTVACNGNMFCFDTTQGQWSAFLSGQHYFTAGGVPAGPIPIAVTFTPNPALVTLPDPHPQITTAAAIGTVIGSVAITMSNASTFTGGLSLAEGAAWLGFSGSNVVTTGTPVSGTIDVTVAASQGGISAVYPGASTVILEVH